MTDLPSATITILADFWDTGTTGFDVGDLAIVVGLLLSFVGLVVSIAAAVRKVDAWRDRRHQVGVEAIMKPHLEQLEAKLVEQTASIASTIREATMPIQPTTNGGLSLSDAHVTLNRIEGRLDAIEAQQVEAKLDRSKILDTAAVNAKVITDAFLELGAELRLIPLVED